MMDNIVFHEYHGVSACNIVATKSSMWSQQTARPQQQNVFQDSSQSHWISPRHCPQLPLRWNYQDSHSAQQKESMLDNLLKELDSRTTH